MPPNKDNQDMRLMNAWLPRQDADALIRIANSRGISRSELLRRAARQIIENDKEHAS